MGNRRPGTRTLNPSAPLDVPHRDFVPKIDRIHCYRWRLVRRELVEVPGIAVLAGSAGIGDLPAARGLLSFCAPICQPALQLVR